MADDVWRVPRRRDDESLPPKLPGEGGVPAPRPAGRRRSRAAAEVPLGSLTQAQHRHGSVCRTCGSERVTRLAMQLTDGTAVDFLSCHVCENRVWEQDGNVIDVDTVLDRTRRPA